MFLAAHFGNPGSYVNFTSVDCRKEPFLEYFIRNINQILFYVLFKFFHS